MTADSDRPTPASIARRAPRSAPIAGCATLGDPGQPLVPTEYQTRTGPFVRLHELPDRGRRAGDPQPAGAARRQSSETSGLQVRAERARRSRSTS